MELVAETVELTQNDTNVPLAPSESMEITMVTTIQI